MLTHMQVFNDFIMPTTIETLGQMTAKFNEASGGAILLTGEGFVGDFKQESFWAGIHGAGRRVNRYGANAAVAATDLTQLEKNSVKIAGGIGPVLYEPSQLTWLEKPTAEAIEVASRNFAEIMLADQLNTAISIAAAAIKNVAALVNDVSATGPLSYVAQNGAHAKFGDNSMNLITSVMNGAAYHSLIGQNLANAETLFRSEGVLVVDILGKRTVITDSPALEDATTRTSLSLVAGGVTVHDGGDVISNIETSNGKERIETTLQVDYTFAAGIKGYSWDVTNGGKSPTDAALATGTNWDQVVTNVKHTAGVAAVGDKT